MEQDGDVEPEIRDSIVSLVSALGGTEYEGEDRVKYGLGDDALGCLKDIRKWLRMYDERMRKLDVARCIADTTLVLTDIPYILAQWSEEEEENALKFRLALACVEILVPLTWEVNLDGNFASADQYVHESTVLRAQSRYRRIILNAQEGSLLRRIIRVALPALAMKQRDRSARDEGMVKLVVCLIRNLAMIKSHAMMSDVQWREEIIVAFQNANVFDLVLAIGAQSQEDFKGYEILVVEVLYHLFKGLRVDVLFLPESESETRPFKDLSNLLLSEQASKAQQSQHLPTRHNRFGTTVSLLLDKDRRLTVSGQRSAIGKDETSIAQVDKVKRNRKPVRHFQRTELDLPVSLPSKGAKIVHDWIICLLQGGFNPLVRAMIRSLERDPGQGRMQFLYVVGFTLSSLREEWVAKTAKLVPDDSHQDQAFGLVAEVFDRRCLVMVMKIMREAADLKEWDVLHTAMYSFEQILLCVRLMGSCETDEYQEIAENVQLNLFYDEAIFDMIANIVKMFKLQSFGFLDVCTSVVTTIISILESFFKTRDLLFTRSKARRRRRNKDDASMDLSAGDDDLRRKYAERAVTYEVFEKKFMNEACLATFLTYLEYYPDLEPRQVKRALKYLHRFFVIREKEVPMFRLDVCELLYRMCNDYVGFKKDNPLRKEFEKFTAHYSKRLFSCLELSPAMYVELLFSKIHGQVHYLQHGYDKVAESKQTARAPAHFQVAAHFTEKEKLGIVIAALLDENKSDVLDVIKQFYANATSERRAWIDLHKAKAIESDKSSETLIPSIRINLFQCTKVN